MLLSSVHVMCTLSIIWCTCHALRYILSLCQCLSSTKHIRSTMNCAITNITIINMLYLHNSCYVLRYEYGQFSHPKEQHCRLSIIRMTYLDIRMVYFVSVWSVLSSVCVYFVTSKVVNHVVSSLYQLGVFCRQHGIIRQQQNVLGKHYGVFCKQYSVLNKKYSVLSKQYRVLNKKVQSSQQAVWCTL